MKIKRERRPTAGDLASPWRGNLKRFCAALVLCAAIGSMSRLAALEADWKVGTATIEITPEKPVRLAGYASRTEPYEGVARGLFAKALALEDAGGERGLIITVDILGIEREIVERVCARITEKTGLERKQMLINWSHIHSGPAVSLSVDPEGDVDAKSAQDTVDYTHFLMDQLVEVATRAVSELTPARLSRGVGVAHITMNRREFTPERVILGVHPRGPVDRSVPVLRVDAPDGTLRAALFGYACHNTTLTHREYQVSADYAGFAQDYVRYRHPGAEAMFVAGLGGDANPYPRGTLEIARRHGEALGEEVCRVLAGELKSVSGPLRVTLGEALLPLRQPPRQELEEAARSGPGWLAGGARRMLADLDAGRPLAAVFPCPVAVWQFGEDLTLVALSGEVVVDYVALIEEALGPLDLWLAAYSNASFGYVPSARVLREGGYETRGIYRGYGWFAPGAEDALVSRVRELAIEAGRSMGAK